MTQGGQNSQVQIDLTGAWAKQFKRLGRVEVAGYIWESVSSFGPFGVYKGDGREFAQGAIPITNSRFYASLDFNQGRGFIQVNHTESVDGQKWPAWPIRFNPPGSGGGPLILMVQPPC